METRKYSPFIPVHEHVREALMYATPKVKPGGLLDRLAFRTMHGNGIRREIREAIIDTPDNFLSEDAAKRLANVTEGRIEVIWMGRRSVGEQDLHEREKAVKDNLQEDIFRDALQPTSASVTLQERLLLSEGPIWEFAGILAQALASQALPDGFTWRTFFETRVLMPFFQQVTKK